MPDDVQEVRLPCKHSRLFEQSVVGQRFWILEDYYSGDYF